MLESPPMIQLQDIRYSIGTRVLFENVTWVVAPGDRCALIGPNGAGKTTLINVALGNITPEAGNRVLSKGTRLGYLPQEAAEKFEGTVLDRCLEAHRSLLNMREEMDEIHRRMETISPEDPDLERLLARAGDLQHHLELNDEHILESEARRILGGLGFSTEDQDRPISEFSGGWRMRAALGALLLSDPTVLFLDEPTNHLDLPAMEWLEEFLEEFQGGLVVISHDRVFLDRVTNEVKELEFGTLTSYATTFTGYLEEKQRRREQMAAENAQLDQKIAQLSRFVERFGAKNTKAAQARSKKKMIDRLRDQRLVIPRKAQSIHFAFPKPPHAGRRLLALDQVSFRYEDRPILNNVELHLERGEKVAIVGANGAGKTTLLRILAQQLQPQSGTCEVFELTRMAYFAQHAAEILNPKLTVLDALDDVANNEWRPRLRSVLGSFLFHGDDVFKTCRVLSGGERQRVALARILLREANLILLDEPTHHLDLAGKEVLEDALEQYPGGVVVVTHDRSLMARVATRVIEVNAGRAILYPGGYADYEEARLKRLESGLAVASTPSPIAVAAPAEPKKPAKAPPAKPAEPQISKAQAKKKAQEIARIEGEIKRCEVKVKELESTLADPKLYGDGGDKARTTVIEYNGVKAKIERLWEELEEIG